MYPLQQPKPVKKMLKKRPLEREKKLFFKKFAWILKGVDSKAWTSCADLQHIFRKWFLLGFNYQKQKTKPVLDVKPKFPNF